MATVLAHGATLARRLTSRFHESHKLFRKLRKRSAICANYNRHMSVASVFRNESSSTEEALWVKSPEPDCEIPENLTMMEHVWEKVRQHGKLTYMECGVTGRKYTFDELYRYSRGIGAGLMKLGLQRHDIVGIVMQNLPEFPIGLFGALDAGLTVSPVNPMYTADEIGRQLVHAGASVVICSEYFAPAVIEASKAHKLKAIIVLGKAPEGCISFTDLMKTDPTGFEFLKGSDTDARKHIALLPFSSGTTGPPKGVALSHYNLLANGFQYGQESITVVRPVQERKHQERLVGILPFFHAFGSSSIVFLGAIQGAHVMVLPNFNPASFTKTIKSHKPTTIHLVTPIISFMTQYPEIVTEDFQSVECILAAAAPIGSEIINQLLNKAQKDIFFQEAYGMTELSPASHAIPWRTGNTKVGSCGVPLSNTTCKVVDPQSGKVLGPNERGELLIRGPQVMLGYYKNEKATAETLDADGWLRTGDICYYDEDKHFYIVDRLKELIKVKGFQVAPSELEGILRDHPGVADVAVIGVPNTESGELPRAYIVKKDEGLKEKDLHKFLEEKVAPFKQLRGGIEFVDAIPKAPSGKILRRELLLAYKQEKGIA